jgi:hypothetical protein
VRSITAQPPHRVDAPQTCMRIFVGNSQMQAHNSSKAHRKAVAQLDGHPTLPQQLEARRPDERACTICDKMIPLHLVP